MWRRFACGILISCAWPAFCQQLPSFETAAVKLVSHPSPNENHSDVTLADARRFRAVNADLSELIEWAYEVRADHISGPDDVHSKIFTYDIDATVPEQADKAQARLMLRRLLTERFGVVLHSITKPTSGYSLAVDRGGTKLKPSALEHSAGVTSYGGSASAHLVSPAVRMGSLASALSRDLGVPVADQTHIDGLYVLDIQFSKFGTDSDLPTVFDAVKGLGLRLDKAQIPGGSIVVEHANFKPGEN